MHRDRALSAARFLQYLSHQTFTFALLSTRIAIKHGIHLRDTQYIVYQQLRSIESKANPDKLHYIDDLADEVDARVHWVGAGKL